MVAFLHEGCDPCIDILKAAVIRMPDLRTSGWCFIGTRYVNLMAVSYNRAGQGFARPATPRLVSDSRASAAQLNAKHSSMQSYTLLRVRGCVGILTT